MMDPYSEYALFVGKLLTVVLVLALFALVLAAAGGKRRLQSPGRLTVRNLGRRYRQMALAVESARAPKKKLPWRRRQMQHRESRVSKGPTTRRAVYVLDFNGDLVASAVASLREEVSAVIQSARPDDSVLLRLESAGGLVHAYGLAAAQLRRLRDHGIAMTVAVDKVAASGGYMMACVADRLIAAPFAILGSIGVVAQLPNFHRFLQKHDIDFEQFTAGEYKRTVTLFGETTDQARTKQHEQIEEIHKLFKEFVKEHRPAVDIERVSTGEYWFGSRAVELHLVDDISTSDDYLLSQSTSADLFEVRYARKKRAIERLLARDESEASATDWPLLSPANWSEIR